MKENNWQIESANMTTNIQDYNNPKLPRFIKGGEGGEHNPTPTRN